MPRTEEESLKEAIREAHATLKTLRHEITVALKVRDEVAQQAYDIFHGMARAMVDGEMASYMEGVRAAGREITQALVAHLKKQSNLALYGNEQGRGQNIFEKVDELHRLVEIEMLAREAKETGRRGDIDAVRELLEEESRRQGIDRVILVEEEGAASFKRVGKKPKVKRG